MITSAITALNGFAFLRWWPIVFVQPNTKDSAKFTRLARQLFPNYRPPLNLTRLFNNSIFA
jgi:hypothetical protein